MNLGTNIVRVIAVDKDTDNNGRVSYVITSGNEDSRFSLGYDSGILTLMKPIVRDTVLQIAANDHGSPPRRSIMNLTVSIAVGQTSGPPRLLLPNPAATISENLVVGGFIINVVGSTLSEQGELTYFYLVYYNIETEADGKYIPGYANNGRVYHRVRPIRIYLIGKSLEIVIVVV